VDRDEAVVQLPVVYQLVVAWLDEGRTADEIGARLGIDPHAVPALIELATNKLARAMQTGGRR
jgi:DNA-directed RNA polymerase specialized sigma24 family protein